MAYETGSATGPNDMLIKLRDLIAANADKTKVREIDERISATMRRFNERAAVVI